MGRYATVQRASDALELVSMVKSIGRASPQNLICRDPALTARQLLKGA